MDRVTTIEGNTDTSQIPRENVPLQPLLQAQSLNAGGGISIYQNIGGTLNVPEILPALHQLPASPDFFVGRAEELESLINIVTSGRSSMIGLHGLSGVGKTTLAIKLAELLTPHFENAQIYIDLRSGSSSHLSIEEVITHIVRSFYPNATLTPNQGELIAHYRALLNRTKVIVLLDNVVDDRLVEQLIPPKHCLLIVTSRIQFNIPGMVHRVLRDLESSAAIDLVQHIAPRAQKQADQIAVLCGYLPLALRLAASAITVRKDIDPEYYVDLLSTQQHRSELADKVLGLTLNLIGSEVREHLYFLSIFPLGFDISAVTAILQLTHDQAFDILGILFAYSLVEWNDSQKRYYLPDLVQLVCCRYLKPEQWNTISIRHCMYYSNVLIELDKLYKAGGENSIAAVQRFDLEWSNLRQAQIFAASHIGNDPEITELANRYPDRARYLLSLRQHPSVQIQWIEAGLDAARKLGKRVGEATHLGNLGMAYSRSGDMSTAIRCYQQSLDISKADNDEGRIIGMLLNMAGAYMAIGNIPEALNCYHQIEEFTDTISDQNLISSFVTNLGTAHLLLGNKNEAKELYEYSLNLMKMIGDKQGEALILGNIGNLYADMNQFEEAIKSLENSLEISRQIGDQHQESSTLGNIGLVLLETNHLDEALAALQQGLAISIKIEDKQGQAEKLFKLGGYYVITKDYTKAKTYLEQSLKLARVIGDQKTEATCGTMLSWVSKTAGLEIQTDISPAMLFRYYSQIGHADTEQVLSNLKFFYLKEELDSLRNQGSQLLRSDNPANAIGYYRQAIAISRLLEDKDNESSLLGSIADVFIKLNKHNHALKYLYQSLSLADENNNTMLQALVKWNIGSLKFSRGDLTIDDMQSMNSCIEVLSQTNHPKVEEFTNHLHRMNIYYAEILVQSIRDEQMILTPDETIKKLSFACEIFKGNNKGDQILLALIQLGESYYEFQDVQSAINTFREAKDLARDLEDQIMLNLIEPLIATIERHHIVV